MLLLVQYRNIEVFLRRAFIFLLFFFGQTNASKVPEKGMYPHFFPSEILS